MSQLISNHAQLPLFNTRTAFDYYRNIEHRLPADADSADPSRVAQRAAGLIEIADQFDVFVFDAFGVLNVGESTIAGSHECLDALRKLGKRIFVLTNGASAPLSKMPAKFEKFGFTFSDDEIVSSRYCAEQALTRISQQSGSPTLWGAITCGVSSAEDLAVSAIEVSDVAADFDRVDAFVFLSASTWTATNQALLVESMKKRPRHLVVANPDVIAPKESGFSLEPGYFSHELLDSVELPFEFHGKPFKTVFDEIERRCNGEYSLNRIAMVGDTLHTDVLGGNSRNWGSILVTDHGLFRGHAVDRFIEESGIVPDWIVPSI